MFDNRLGPGLEQRMASLREHDSLDVNIFLRGEHSRTLAERSRIVHALDAATAPFRVPSDLASELRERCRVEQQDLVAMLTQGSFAELAIDQVTDAVAKAPTVTSYWINNSVAAVVNSRMLREILKRPEIGYVEIERHIDPLELLDAKKKTPAKSPAKKRQAPDKTASQKPSAKMVATVSGGLMTGGEAEASKIPWSVQRINAPQVWASGINGAEIIVAVIDTGVNYHHPDLKSRMWKGGARFPKHGYNFSEGNNDPQDQHGHGTACAGQVAGTGSLGQQTGVAPGATIMAIRVGGRERNFWDAMQFAITNNVNVISMSMSWKYPSSPNYPGWRRVCESILAAGVLHANSIGNQGDQLAAYPIPFNIATPGNCPPPRLHPLQLQQGGLSSVISCGATDDLDQLAAYSGRGPAEWNIGPFADYPWNAGQAQGLIKPDLCAPGPGTLSCNWRYHGSAGRANPYVSFGGTSAATPHIAGCLALLAHACKKAEQPIISARIQEALENTAVRVLGQSVDKENHYGAGRVDVLAAYEYGQSRGWW